MWVRDGIHKKAMILVNQEGHPDFGPYVEVVILPSDPKSYEKMVEQMAAECSIGLVSAYIRGQMDVDVTTEKREDYALAQAVLRSIGITEPKKKRNNQ